MLRHGHHRPKATSDLDGPRKRAALNLTDHATALNAGAMGDLRAQWAQEADQNSQDAGQNGVSA